jgi:hypothetical protein
MHGNFLPGKGTRVWGKRLHRILSLAPGKYKHRFFEAVNRYKNFCIFLKHYVKV